MDYGTIGIALSLGLMALLLAVVRIPEVGFLLQCYGVGTVVGTVNALRARTHGFVLEAWRIVARWGVIFVGLGFVVVAVDALR